MTKKETEVNPADNTVQISKLLPRSKFSGSRNHAKPPPRYKQWHQLYIKKLSAEKAISVKGFWKIF
jgi:hypothetical protein